MEEGGALLLPCRVPPERRGKIWPDVLWGSSVARRGEALDNCS